MLRTFMLIKVFPRNIGYNLRIYKKVILKALITQVLPMPDTFDHSHSSNIDENTAIGTPLFKNHAADSQHLNSLI